MSHSGCTRAAPSCDMFNLGSSYFHVALTTVRHLLNVMHGESRDQHCNQVWRPYAYPFLSWSYNVSRWLPLKMRTRLLRMRRITWLVSRGSKTITFLYARPRFAYSLCNFGGSTMKVIKVICENNARPCVKRRMSFSACAKSSDMLKVPLCPIAVVLVDVNLPYWTSKVEHIAAFTAIFSNICTAHAQKRLFMNFQCKLRHRRLIRWPRFPLIFAFYMLNVRHISTSGLFDLLT